LVADRWFERGQFFETEERLEEAEAAYRNAISRSPNFPEAYFNLGKVLLELGQPDAAEEAYKNATTQDPSFALVQPGTRSRREGKDRRSHFQLTSLYGFARVR